MSSRYCIHVSKSHGTKYSCINILLYLASCRDGEARLRNGVTNSQGRLEVCLNSQWGTVCDNGWGSNDAGVACRQLGFSASGTMYW